MGTVWLFFRFVAFSFAGTVKINKQNLHLNWMSIAPNRKSSTWHLQQVDVFLLHYFSKKEDFLHNHSVDETLTTQPMKSHYSSNYHFLQWTLRLQQPL